ncbi:MAG: polysaccharide pyruvyl transferase family protein [Parvularculaceae bacterium]
MRLNFIFDADKANAELDAVIIPAANWIGAHVDFSHVAALIEKLKIPVVLIGLGAQSENYDGEIAVPAGTRRFLTAVFDRSARVSVRGEYTASVLKKLGYANFTVTGCPSLYCDFRRFEKPAPGEFEIRRCLVNATRYSAVHMPNAREESPNWALMRFAFKHRLDLLFQSEPEELALLFGFEGPEVFNERVVMMMKEIYDAKDWLHVRDYVLKHGRAFLDVDEWAEAVAHYQFVYGTRLHGTIMALNSGVSAMLLWHDSRTREIAEFAAMPSMDANLAEFTESGLARAYESLDLKAYFRRREENRTVYKRFLQENGLAESKRPF